MAHLKFLFLTDFSYKSIIGFSLGFYLEVLLQNNKRPDRQRPQLQANTAWNESLFSSLRKRVSLVLPCWTLAQTISFRPFCTTSAMWCMLSIVRGPSNRGSMVHILHFRTKEACIFQDKSRQGQKEAFIWGQFDKSCLVQSSWLD